MALKNEILEILERNRGSSVSGQELASRLGVSRAAVWKAINALKREGHELDAATNRGYMLRGDSDVLTAEGIKSYLTHAAEVRVLNSVDSTNNAAKVAAAEGMTAPAVIAAESQTGGKGRRGRSFYCAKGSGAYFSVLLKPKVSAEKSVLVTSAAAVATAEAITELTGLDARIKWLNDVYVDGKKCVGILCEATFDCENGELDSVIVGIGVNVGEPDFPPELAGKAGSIGHVRRNELIARITDKLLDLTSRPADHLAEYRKKCFVLGERVIVTGGGREYEAEALDVDGMGRLIVTTDGTDKILLSNEEVSAKPKE